MSRIIYLILLCLLRSSKAEQKWEQIQSTTPSNIQEDEARDVIRRLLPDHYHLFDIKVHGPNFAPKNRDKVVLLTKPILANGAEGFYNRNITNIISVTSNTGVAAVWGINHYLKYFCNSHISWDTTRIEIPSPLPQVNLTLTSLEKFRYHMNVCTFGYTYAFWQWHQWEQHIDWMALNGINLPLAFVAQESIWQRVYTKLGLTPKDLSLHFAGPAFLAWQRMGNMYGWGGPLPPSWHEFQVKLQHRILKRMRKLGMTPVLPAFAGHIPKALLVLYPNITYTSTKWNHFGPTYLLDSTDPLFNPIGSSFIKEYIEEFGDTDHVYNCDAFNEMTPASNDPGFIRKSGKAIYDAIASVDENAVWIMQGWLFRSSFWKRDQAKALLTSVEPGEMIVLDLASTEFTEYDRLDSFFGQPFVFNDLNNYGGNTGFFGRIGRINERLFQARNMTNTTIIGIGLTPEGLSDAYPTAELMLEMSWRNQPVDDMSSWFSNYTRRRYGKYNKNAIEAWTALVPNVLNSTSKFFNRKLLVSHLPSLHLTDYIWYNVSDVANAWDHFMDAADDLHTEEGYRFDLVDITRQFIVNVAPKFYHFAVKAYHEKNIQGIIENSGKFLEMLGDLDAILATNKHFLLGVWLEDAKAVPNSDKYAMAESSLYEFNARNQITLWGPNGEILDYATKQWSGLVRDYYYPRWQLFYNQLMHCVKYNTTFDYVQYKNDFLENIGKPFTMDKSEYPTHPIGDSIFVARKLYRKWRHEYNPMNPFWRVYEYTTHSTDQQSDTSSSSSL